MPWLSPHQQLEPVAPPEGFDKVMREVAAALEDADKAALQLPATLAAIDERLAQLKDSGALATREFALLGEKRADIAALIDPVQAVANEANRLAAAAQAAQDKSALLWQALGEGKISGSAFEEGMKSFGDLPKDADKATQSIKGLAQELSAAGTRFTEDFVSKLVDGIGEGTFKIGDFAEQTLKAFAKIMLNRQVQEFMNLMEGKDSDGKPSGGGSGWSALIKAIAGWFGFAKGGAFTSSRSLAAYENQIVTQPTLFKFAQGGRFGVMGEVPGAAEAIVPLRRDRNGDLGVSSTSSPISITINNTAAQDTEVKASERTGPNAERLIEIEVKKIIKQSISDGSLDRGFRANYGLSRTPSMG